MGKKENEPTFLDHEGHGPSEDVHEAWEIVGVRPKEELQVRARFGRTAKE